MFKKLQKTAAITAVLALMFVLLPGVKAQAAVHNYPGQYAQIELPDDVLIMSSATSKYDEVWLKAGVTDASAKLKEFSNMGVVAAFFDPNTKITVNFISKQNSDTVDVFTFDNMSDAEIETYVNGLITSNEDVDTSVSVLHLGGIPYFRLTLAGKSEKAVGTEVIYGTAKNGMIIQFDVFSQTLTEIDESFLKTVASGLSFTKTMTLEEYQVLAQEAAHKFLIRAGIFFGLIIALIIYYFIHKARSKKRLAKISDAISSFRDRRSSGEMPDDAEPLYSASSTYNDEALNTFTVYNTWIKALPILVPCALLYLVIVYIMLTYGYPMYALITVVIGIIVLYMHYNRLDKLREAMKKGFGIKNNPVLNARFYAEYLTTSGLGSFTEYPYLQVTSVNVYHDYIFIYTSSETAIIIKNSGVDGGKANELVAFLKNSVKELNNQLK